MCACASMSYLLSTQNLFLSMVKLENLPASFFREEVMVQPTGLDNDLKNIMRKHSHQYWTSPQDAVVQVSGSDQPGMQDTSTKEKQFFFKS